MNWAGCKRNFKLNPAAQFDGKWHSVYRLETEVLPQIDRKENLQKSLKIRRKLVGLFKKNLLHNSINHYWIIGMILCSRLTSCHILKMC